MERAESVESIFSAIVDTAVELDEFTVPERLVEDFKKHIVWVAIMKLVKEHIRLLYEAMIDCPPYQTFVTENGRVRRLSGVEYFQGALEEALNIESLPDRVITLNNGGS